MMLLDAFAWWHQKARAGESLTAQGEFRTAEKMLHAAPSPWNSIDVVRWRLDLLDECPKPLGCDECQHMYCLLQRILPAEIHFAPPLEWARAHFLTPVPETDAKVRHYVVVVEADWLGLRLSLRDSGWEIRAVGAADVLRRRVLQPILHSLLPRTPCFRICRFRRELGAFLGWHVLADIGLLAYLDAERIPIVLPSACASTTWLARMHAHGQRFWETLPKSLRRYDSVLLRCRLSFWEYLLASLFDPKIEVHKQVMFPSAAWFMSTPREGYDDIGEADVVPRSVSF